MNITSVDSVNLTEETCCVYPSSFCPSLSPRGE